LKTCKLTQSRDAKAIKSPSLHLSELPKRLEETLSDVLIIPDCGHAARKPNFGSHGVSREGGRTELLASCRFESRSWTGETCFFRALAKELMRYSKPESGAFTVSTLHRHLYGTRADASQAGKDDKVSSPIHLILNEPRRRYDILLKSFAFEPEVAASEDTEDEPWDAEEAENSGNDDPRDDPSYSDGDSDYQDLEPLCLSGFEENANDQDSEEDFSVSDERSSDDPDEDDKPVWEGDILF
jgi:hypothetical protein